MKKIGIRFWALLLACSITFLLSVVVFAENRPTGIGETPSTTSLAETSAPTDVDAISEPIAIDAVSVPIGAEETASPARTGAAAAPAGLERTIFPVAVDEANFPDATWREYVNTNFAGGDSILTQAEAEAVTVINSTHLDIADLTGLAYFTNTEFLDCSFNALTTLDVSGLTNLQIFYCLNNSLTSLNVQGLANLMRFECSNNFLTFLDLTSLDNIITAVCMGNTLLDIALPAEPANPHYGVQGNSQDIAVNMIADPSGGWMSASTYSFITGHTIALYDGGVTFEADNRFHMASFVAGSGFETDLLYGEADIRGHIHFRIAHTVTFVDWDETELKTQVVVHGEDATAPADPQRDGWEFLGWDRDFTNVTQDLVVKAFYKVSDPESASSSTSSGASSSISSGASSSTSSGASSSTSSGASSSTSSSTSSSASSSTSGGASSSTSGGASSSTSGGASSSTSGSASSSTSSSAPAPTTSTPGAAASKPTVTAAQTGDNRPIILVFVILLLAAGTIVVVLWKRVRQRK